MSGELYSAIDLGSETVKVVSLRRRKDRFDLTGAAMATLSEQERAAEDRDAMLAAVVNRLVRKHGIRLGHTVVGLSGRGTMMRYLQVPMVPPWKLALVMGFEVEEQMGSGGADNVAYDYRILSLPETEEGQFPVLLALAQLPVVEERMAILKSGGCRADDVDLVSLGAFNIYRWSPQCPAEETTLLLDIGAEETHVVLQHDMRLYYVRTVSTGGRQFTNRIQQSLNLLGPEAEEFKQTRARIVARNDDTLRIVEEEGQASDACRAEVRNLAGMVDSSLRFFRGTYHLDDIRFDRVCITGGGSRLKGLTTALQEQLGAPVERLSFDDVIVPSGKSAEAALAGDAAHHFSAAIGMAAARASNGFSVSLLPPRVREQREFWRRRVYAYYSGVMAACLLVLIALGGCPYYGGGWRTAAYHTERAKRWEAHLKAADNAHKEVASLKEQNDRLADQVDALEVRARSGSEMARSLAHIAANTPPDVFFTQLSTSEVTLDEPDDGEDDDAPVGGFVRNEPVPGTFQKNRFIDLKGYLFGAEKEQRAYDRLVSLRDALGDSDVFASVTLVRSEVLPMDSAKVKAAYAMHSAEDATKVIQLKPRMGVAVQFIFRCRIH